MSTKKQRQARRYRCSSGKTRYRDHKEAMDSIRYFQLSSDRDTVPVRAYECSLCGGWHVTSKEFGAASREEGYAPSKDKFEAYLNRKIQERFGDMGNLSEGGI
jgi:hypothetical protein